MIHRITSVRLYFLPVQTRVPLKFGHETLTSVTCARVCLRVADERGAEAEGWGETPLSVQWVWPSPLPYETRHAALKAFCCALVPAWAGLDLQGHPLELGHHFQEHVLPRVLAGFTHGNAIIPRPDQGTVSSAPEPDRGLPLLAALVCCSAFDIALHDAFGQLIGQPIYATYDSRHIGKDLASFLEPAPGSLVSFAGKWPSDFLLKSPPQQLPAWHLVGGLDPLDAGELTGNEPVDGHPVLLADWIRRDGLRCLKVKLRGNDSGWDFERLLKVGGIAIHHGVNWLSADFNCTVQDPAYVNDVLDRLRDDHPRIFGMLLYVEQPFPYDLEKFPIDVHGLAARKPLFLDESAHDWRVVRLGRGLGWNGVALKTCKTQTGAILSACWAKAHGMALMVQDLTNPMLAQIPHVLLASHVGTIMGVETNSMQFYPAASEPEERVHAGLYQRRSGMVDLSTTSGPGFGYRIRAIHRELPAPAAEAG